VGKSIGYILINLLKYTRKWGFTRNSLERSKGNILIGVSNKIGSGLKFCLLD